MRPWGVTPWCSQVSCQNIFPPQRERGKEKERKIISKWHHWPLFLSFPRLSYIRTSRVVTGNEAQSTSAYALLYIQINRYSYLNVSVSLPPFRLFHCFVWRCVGPQTTHSPTALTYTPLILYLHPRLHLLSNWKIIIIITLLPFGSVFNGFYFKKWFRTPSSLACASIHLYVCMKRLR